MPELLIDPYNVFINPDISDRKELFMLFHRRLYKKGLVKKGFYEALRKREDAYPTGLDTGRYKIALPHTDPCMVNTQALAVAVLGNPVLFGEMGSAHKNIKVSIVFLVMIKEQKTIFYRNLLNKIKNSDILHKIYNTNDRYDLCLLLTKLLNT